MAFVGKYTNIKDVIERVRRTGFNSFTEEEAKEWIWEAINLIDNTANFVSKVAILNVEDGRVELPYDVCDLSESGVRDYYTKIVLTKDYNIYRSSEILDDNIINSIPRVIGESNTIVDGSIVSTDVFTYYDNNCNCTPNNAIYRFNNGFIETGFKTGIIELSYKAFPIDENGDPLIEDDVKVIRAVVSYIIRMVAERLYNIDELQEKKFDRIERKAMFHMASAKSNSSLKSVDDWEAISVRTNRLFRDQSLNRTGFAGYSNREILRF